MLPANAVCWIEIPVSDLERSRSFYETVLKNPMREMNMGPNQTYVFACEDNSGVAGHIYVGKPAPGGIGPTVHLVVPDTVEAAMERLKGAGGTEISPAIEIPAGRFAYATDPDGNSIGLFQGGN